MRLIRQGALLVADDITMISNENGRLIASPPPAIAGMIEVRGIGICRVPYVATTAIAVVIDLALGQKVERMPDTAGCEILGVRVSSYAFSAFDASSVDKVRLAADLAAGRASLVS